jgi:DNA-directed RNA polymerase subunit beta
LQILNDKNLKRSKNRKIRVKQDILFGEVPLITDEGTFIINGCERIVISQIIRSPGIYFRKEFGTSRKTIYTATVISNKGLWTKFILDQIGTEKASTFSKDKIYIRLNEFKQKNSELTDEENRADKESDKDKVFIYDLIRYFGLNVQEILDSLKYPLHFSNLQLTNKEIEGITDDIQKKIKIRENTQVIKKLFFNQRSGCFSIGEIGRYKINKKLGINLPKDITYLTAHDFIGIIDGLIELKYYDRVSDDIDDIKNKQIRSIGDLLQNQIRIGLYRLQKSLIEESSIVSSQKLSFEVDTYSNPEDWVIDPRPVTSSIKEFFKTSQLSQFMDQINPLSELTHKRRISVFGPNGLKRDHISTVIRDIHPSQYGRLCPIETPEGQNAGLITSMALYGRISSLGSIETPYFLVQDNKVFSDKKPIFLNPEQESETIVAVADISLTNQKKIVEEYISIKENNLFSLKKSKDINFITTSPLQIVSLATALIPFLEHDDANRALMGSNMQRQAVPLIYTQKPIVGTGLETAAILDSSMVIKSYCQGTVLFSSANSIKILDDANQSITYYLRKYYRSNQETCINQRPIVWSGEEVFSGQIIADGPSTNDGELSLGKNLTIAYMPWEGYNYEDAIVINERIIIEDCLTSIHIEEHETTLTYCVTGSEKLTNSLPHLTKHISRHLNSDGIVKVGSYVK